jgi:hypothetical protein
VLANRLKQILPLIISKTHSAFIPGRLITDNVLVAYEALHTMAAKLKGKKGYMAIKLDMTGWSGIIWKPSCANWASLINGFL